MKEKVIGKIRLLVDTLLNDKGDIVLAYKETETGDVYYYDSEDRWCYISPGEYEWVYKET